MKKTVNNYTKEVIKSRILQNITKLWGVSDPNALDPFVTLFVDAFSTEIFKVNNDIENVKERILEKLARLLTPSIYTHPRPAHAVALIHPTESKEVLFDHQEFFTKKIVPSQVKAVADLNLDIPFTAVDQINLIKGQVCYRLIGDTLWGYDAFYNSVAVAKYERVLERNELFLALDLSDYELEYLPTSLSLYCDNPTFDDLEFVYKLLPFASMSIKNKALTVTEGLTYPTKKTNRGYQAVFDDCAIAHRIQENIKSIYASKFVEVKGFNRKIVDLELHSLPREIGFLAANEAVSNQIADKQLLWIKIEFPVQYTPEILEGFRFYLNAFPVYNRGWKSNESSLDIMGNTIPLLTQPGEAFLNTQEVTDSHGRIYSETPFAENENVKQGVYTVRKGGMERFSERNALDLISQVVDLTRDEVSAFGILDRDKVIEALGKMMFQMRTLEQKVNAVNHSITREVHYVLVEPNPQAEYVTATYWVTHCALANNIRKGVQLTQQNKVYTNVNKQVVLLCSTQGGEREKQGTDAISAYKYALTTRDKIISKEDLKNYCKIALQGRCVEVQISKGIQVSDKPKEGFVRTIHIEITVDHYEEFSSQYWCDYARRVKKQIENRAIDGMEYRVVFKGEVVNE